MYSRRRRQRSRSRVRWLQAFVIFEVIVGGLTGIVAGALIIEWFDPGNPISGAIRDAFRRILFVF